MKNVVTNSDGPHSNHVVRFRLYPTQIQEAKFQQNAEAARFIWNTYLAAKEHNYSRKLAGLEPLPVPTLREAKALLGFEWLKEADQNSLNETRRDLDKAYSQWFSDMKRPEGSLRKSKPRFKSRFTSKLSFRVQQSMEVDLESHMLRAAKHGWIKARGDWSQVPAEGSIQTITVSKSAHGWYASALFRVPPVVLKNDFPFEACGIDLGVKIPVALSYDDQGIMKDTKTGVKFSRDLSKKELRVKKWQRRLAKKVKGSKNRAKTKHQLSRVSEDRSNFRKDFLEKTSYQIASSFDAVVVEDLKLSKMTRRVKRVKNEDGTDAVNAKTGKRVARTNVAAKAGLNRELLRLGLASLVAKVESKKNRRFGGKVVRVDPRFTSQTCYSCGAIDKESRQTQSRYCCTSCGFTLNADFNAARNILQKGSNSYS